MTHKEWLDNEYSEWVKALSECTVHNFKDNHVVKRMLGCIEFTLHAEDAGIAFTWRWHVINKIDRIGYSVDLGDNMEGCRWSTGGLLRMVYYAQKVLKQNPGHICEIGGGVGQFYAVLRALGYNGKYYIYDLPEVQDFQRKYLDEVTKLTGLNTELKKGGFDFCVSFYAYGEFDDELKSYYEREVITKCPHGFIVFNPHSGASDKINFECKVEPEVPETSPGNKILIW